MDDITTNNDKLSLDDTTTTKTIFNANIENRTPNTNEYLANEQPLSDSVMENLKDSNTAVISNIDDEKNEELQKIRINTSTQNILEQSKKTCPSEDQDSRSIQMLSNRHLQRKIQVLISKGHFPAEIHNFPDDNPNITLQKYHHLLSDYQELMDESSKQIHENNEITTKLQKDLIEKEQKASELSFTLSQFKQEVALKSVEDHKKSGGNQKLLSQEVLDQLEKQDQEKNEQLEKQRIKNIALTLSIDKTTQKIQEKEHIAQGFTLYDYDKLQTENKNLKRKKMEELETLQKTKEKLDSTITTIYRVNEKLSTQQSKKESLETSVGQVDNILMNQRSKTKELKSKIEFIKKNKSVLTKESTKHSHVLLQDFRQKQDELEQLKNQLTHLRLKHKDIVTLMASSSSKNNKNKNTYKNKHKKNDNNNKQHMENPMNLYLSKTNNAYTTKNDSVNKRNHSIINKHDNDDDNDDDDNDNNEIPKDIQKLAEDYLRLK